MVMTDEQKAKKKVYLQEYRKKNREAMNENARRYREANREKVRESARKSAQKKRDEAKKKRIEDAGADL